MNKLKKLFYYLFNDRKYIRSYLDYKLRSNQSIFFVFFRFIFGISLKSKVNDSNLLFIYDLELNPLTFNFGQYLANAIIYSRKKSLKNIDLLIIKSSSSNPIKTKKLKLFMSENEAANRIYEVVISTFRLTQKSNNLYLSSNNDHNIKKIIDNYKHIYPDGYSTLKPIPCPTGLPNVDKEIFFPMYGANLRAKEIINKYLEGIDKKKIITFTFRDLKHMEGRNSQYNEWIKFSQYLIKKDYQIFLIPEPLNYNRKFYEKFSNCSIAEIVLWNLNLRTALYEEAFLNCCVDSGIFDMTACYNQNVNSLIFVDFDSFDKNYLELGKKKWGWTTTINQKWMSNNQNLIYKKDNFENMVEAFNNLLDKKNSNK